MRIVSEVTSGPEVTWYQWASVCCAGSVSKEVLRVNLSLNRPESEQSYNLTKTTPLFLPRSSFLPFSTLSPSLSVSLYPGDSVDVGSPALGAVPQVTLVLAEVHIDVLLSPETAAQPFRGGEFD